MKAVIHCNKVIPWQAKRVQYFAEGLRRKGISYRITDSRTRLDEGFPILFGTTLWRGIENDGGEYLLVDRCSYGDTEKYVSLVWNGHGRRGDHRLPLSYDASRWEKHSVPLLPWKRGSKYVICGQTESYCDTNLLDWYRKAGGTYFRKHPAGDNPTGLPLWQSFDDCELITLNSSVAVLGIVNGVHVRVDDFGGMAYGTNCNDEGRLRLMHWLAWTQWSDDEINEGLPWDYHL